MFRRCQPILESCQNKNFPEMRNFLKTVGSNHILLGGKLIMNFQKQYELLSNLSTQARAIGSSEAEQKAINEKWWTCRESNSELSNANAAVYHLPTSPWRASQPADPISLNNIPIFPINNTLITYSTLFNLRCWIWFVLL